MDSFDDQKIITLADAKQKVEAFLFQHVERRTVQAKQLSLSYHQLWKTIYTLLKAGGKRFRPYILLLSYQAFAPNKDITPAIPAAAAQELLHLAMLVHDDIIDRDTLRYGTQNVSGTYLQKYKQLIVDPQERTHFSNSAALLAGDLLLSDAHFLLLQTSLNPSLVTNAQHTMTEAVFTVVGGELIDTESTFIPHDESSPLDIAEQKTASYSFVTPLLIGAQLADVQKEQQTILTALGNTLGIGYQLRDDLLGIFGDSTITGKSVSSDIEEGKYTYLIESFYQLASSQQKQEFERSFGKGAVSPQEINHLRKLLTESGAHQKIEEIITEKLQQAQEYIEQLTIAKDYKEQLLVVAQQCLRREH